jgi:hypothetical protein
MLYFTMGTTTITVDPKQQKLIVGQVFAFRNVDGSCWIGRVDSCTEGPPNPASAAVIGKVTDMQSSPTLH